MPYTETLEFAADYFTKVHQEVIKKMNTKVDPPIKQAEFVILEIIYLNPGLIQSELANKVSIQSGYISKLLTNLEKEGYIRREQSTKGSRRISYSLFITEKGKKAYKKIQQFVISFKYEHLNEDDIKRHNEAAHTLMELASILKNKYELKF